MQRDLIPNLRVAACGRDLVFLNLNEGIYDLMAGAAPGAEPTPNGAGLTVCDQDLDAALQEAGWFADFAAASLAEPLPALPTQSILDASPAAWSTSDEAAMLGAWTGMSWRFWRRSFLDMTRIARQARQDGRPPRADVVRHRARGVHQRMPWLPIQGDCLFRCALLLHTLEPRDRAAVKWVFGVKTWPFYAHCWLQLADLALTDHHEPLLGFSPIYAA